MRFYAWAVALLMASVALAGCSGGDAPPAQQDDDLDDPKFTDDTGAIQGLVISEDLLPVQGASAALQEDLGSEVKTNSEGRFLFNDLAPGKYAVIVQALGYEATKKSVDVAAGAATQVEFSLKQLAPENVPYQVTIGPIPGKFFCGFAIEGAIAGPCKIIGFADQSNPVETTYQIVASGEANIFEFRTAVEDNKTLEADRWESLVAEVTWEPVAASATRLQATIEELPESPGARQSTEPKYARGSGVAPLKIVIHANEQHERGDEAMPDDAPGFLIGVFPDAEGQAAAAYSEQRFEVWFTLFYNKPAGEDFTLFSDQ